MVLLKVIVKATFLIITKNKIMKKKLIIIGIDVSKATLDVFVYSIQKHFIVSNNSKGFSELIEIILVSCKCRVSELFFCFENTGRYSKMLSIFLQSQGISFAMVPALEIKKSLGITRGKNDKVDSRRIAIYAYEKRESIKPTVLSSEKINSIKSLLSLREKLVKHRTAYKNDICDLEDCYREGDTKMIREIQQRLIDAEDAEIEKIEKAITEIIESDQSMNTNYGLILSVRGIGKIIAFYLTAYTENFTAFINPRSFACFAGIAPFANSSGTVTGRSHVHPYGNKQIKGLLNMAAMSAIQIPGEYKQYYKKRTEAGKNKMSTLNIIRNKIVFRAFAVVKRGTPYVNFMKYAA